MKRLWRLLPVLLFAALGVHAGTALAQSYPSRPISIVVPFAAGGGIDSIARLISPQMADALYQPVLVENRPGAGGRIGEDFVAKAAADKQVPIISDDLSRSASIFCLKGANGVLIGRVETSGSDGEN